MADLLGCAREMLLLEKFSSSQNALLFRIDARTKVLCAVGGIFIAAFLGSWISAVLVILLCATLARASKIPVKIYLARMIFPFIFGGFVGVTQLFLYREAGVSFGALLFARVLAAASLLNLLSLTTPVTALLGALAWLRIPPIILNLTALMLRFIFLFARESSTVHAAMCSRLAFSPKLPIKERLRNFSALAGAVLLKSLKRAENSYIAMLSRGYSPDSRFYFHHQRELPGRDLAFIALAVILFLGLFIGDKLLRS